MAILTSSVLGPISGKVGTIVGGSWKGIPYIRSVAASISNPQTPAQQEQRMRFSVILVILRTLTSLLKITFRSAAVKMSAFNAAMSLNVKDAVSGIYPALTVNYAALVLAFGNLTGALDPAVAASANGHLDFTWDDNSTDEGAEATDKAILIAVNGTLEKSIGDVTAIERSTGAATLIVPASWAGAQVHCYIAFFNELTNECSTSQHIGTAIVV